MKAFECYLERYATHDNGGHVVQRNRISREGLKRMLLDRGSGMSEKVTIKEVHAAVKSFWDANMSKNAETRAALYATGSCVFTTDSGRAEPARLVVLKREREYLHKDASMQVDLGPIEIHALDDTAAVAYYTFSLCVKQRQISPGKMVEENIPAGRVTQVWHRQPDGRLLFVHEHISIPSE